MKKRLIWLALPAAVILLALAALDNRLTVRNYAVSTDKLASPVRLAVLSDLHGCAVADELAERLAELQLDLILLPGDVFGADQNNAEELALFRQLAKLAPTFYVTGNHEYWEQDVPALLEQIAETGVTVLDQACVQLRVGEQCINICGIPDPYAGAATETALQNTAGNRADGYTILLTHRPELIEQYAAADSFDLVIAGHAHGGQVRIPGIINGLCAPNQGWFPQYAGGEYRLDDMTMIVSRGLSDQKQMHVPRIFNPPEIVIVTIR